jgi:hypothetical protein
MAKSKLEALEALIDQDPPGRQIMARVQRLELALEKLTGLDPESILSGQKPELPGPPAGPVNAA